VRPAAVNATATGHAGPGSTPARSPAPVPPSPAPGEMGAQCPLGRRGGSSGRWASGILARRTRSPARRWSAQTARMAVEPARGAREKSQTGRVRRRGPLPPTAGQASSGPHPDPGSGRSGRGDQRARKRQAWQEIGGRAACWRGRPRSGGKLAKVLDLTVFGRGGPRFTVGGRCAHWLSTKRPRTRTVV